nr:hypothetical protein HAGR004_21250 [Bdellovibrio sp. HAGR004]
MRPGIGQIYTGAALTSASWKALNELCQNLKAPIIITPTVMDITIIIPTERPLAE